MPTLPVYIRVEDLDKWKALPNKSEFIHNALNNDFEGLKEKYLASKPPTPYGITYTPVTPKEAAVKDKVWPDCPRHHVPMDRCRNRH